MKWIILSLILFSVAVNVAYADSYQNGMKGSGVALLNSDPPQMYWSSIRIFLNDQTKIDHGFVLLSTENSTVFAKMMTDKWQFSYAKDGSFHASGPVVSKSNLSYDLVLDGNRLLASAAGSLWKINAGMAGNGQNYFMEYLVSGKNLFGNVMASLTEQVIIPNGNSGQSNIGFFVPLNLEVLRGTTVTWENQDNIGHTVQSINSKGEVIPVFNSSVLKTGDTFSHKFDKPGVYHYYCTIHPWRIGVVTVY